MSTIDRQIEALAGKVRKALKLSTPVNPRKVAEALGGKIEEGKCEHVLADAEIVVRRTDDGSDEGFVIRTSSNRPQPDDTFFLARMIGHVLLHTSFIGRYSKRNELICGSAYVSGYDYLEHEAAEFAAELLMPRREFLSEWRLKKIRTKADISKLASHFGLAYGVVEQRAYWLRLIEEF